MAYEDELAIGVDMGGTSVKIAAVKGIDIIERAEPVPTMDFGTPEAVFGEVGKRIKALQVKYPDLRAVGMGLPGFVDHDAGMADSLANVPGWYDVPARRLLEELSGLPAAVDNDANCMAYAEWKLGAGRGLQNIVCLTLGTGIGGGIVVNDRMLRGSRVSAGEVGQTSVCYNGRVGPFGNRGAVEEYIGNNEMAADAVARYAAAGITRSAEDCTPYKLELAARAGDAIARQAYLDFAEKLGCLIMNLMYTLAPDAFIIGGGVAKAGDLLFEPLDAQLKAQLFPVHYANLRVLPAHFGADAGIIGAGLMAADYAAGRLL